eukprot:jgi/Psemu1/40846/gm1.40846_g
MICIAFFICLRPGEYTGTTRDDQAFLLQDVSFYLGSKFIQHDGPVHELHAATSVTLTFTTQENGDKGEVVAHARSGGSLCDPVTACAHQVLHLRSSCSPSSPFGPSLKLASYFGMGCSPLFAQQLSLPLCKSMPRLSILPLASPLPQSLPAPCVREEPWLYSRANATQMSSSSLPDGINLASVMFNNGTYSFLPEEWLKLCSSLKLSMPFPPGGLWPNGRKGLTARGLIAQAVKPDYTDNTTTTPNMEEHTTINQSNEATLSITKTPTTTVTNKQKEGTTTKVVEKTSNGECCNIEDVVSRVMKQIPYDILALEVAKQLQQQQQQQQREQHMGVGKVVLVHQHTNANMHGDGSWNAGDTPENGQAANKGIHQKDWYRTMKFPINDKNMADVTEMAVATQAVMVPRNIPEATFSHSSKGRVPVTFPGTVGVIEGTENEDSGILNPQCRKYNGAENEDFYYFVTRITPAINLTNSNFKLQKERDLLSDIYFCSG